MVSNRTTLEELFKIYEGNDIFTRHLRLMSYERYDQFVEILHSTLEDIIHMLSENPQEQRNSNETSITNQVVNLLRQSGFQASTETAVGGHCDIKVVGHHNYLWLGEAKIFNGSYQWIWEGFLQLDTRYFVGNVNSNYGGILIYTFKPRIDQIMDKWKDKMKESDYDFLFSKCNDNPHYFYSEHTHNRTGLTAKVKHFILSLFFNPKK